MMAAIKGNELHTASLEGNLKTVKALLAQGDDINVNQRDQYQFCPLHYASMAGHMDVVEALVAAGANVNMKERVHGKTPIHLATDRGHFPVVNFFLNNGGNAKKAAADGTSPMDYAYKENVHIEKRKETKQRLEKIIKQHRSPAGGHKRVTISISDLISKCNKNHKKIEYWAEYIVLYKNGRILRMMPIDLEGTTYWVDVIDNKPEVPEAETLTMRQNPPPGLSGRLLGCELEKKLKDQLLNWKCTGRVQDIKNGCK